MSELHFYLSSACPKSALHLEKENQVTDNLKPCMFRHLFSLHNKRRISSWTFFLVEIQILVGGQQKQSKTMKANNVSDCLAREIVLHDLSVSGSSNSGCALAERTFVICCYHQHLSSSLRRNWNRRKRGSF